jgi:hypothetical protein
MITIPHQQAYAHLAAAVSCCPVHCNAVQLLIVDVVMTTHKHPVITTEWHSQSPCVWYCAAHRLHFDTSTGMIKEQWTWRGACADEAAWLLSRSYKPFDCDTFLQAHSSDSSSSSSDSSSGGGSAAKARATGSALAFREAFGAVPGADVSNLAAALSEDYGCKVWGHDRVQGLGYILRACAAMWQTVMLISAPGCSGVGISH